MSDLSASSSPPDPAELVRAACGQAEEIAALDSGRAEAWASDLLALAADEGISTADLVAALRHAEHVGGVVVLAALHGLGVAERPAGALPEWASAVATSVCEGAWTLWAGGSVSAAFRFVDANDSRHVITVDLVGGPPETVGEVAVAPGDLLDVLEESDAAVEVEEVAAAAAAARVADAWNATVEPRDSAVVSGRILLARLATLGVTGLEPLRFFESEIPEPPERDPEDDAYAIDVLVRALGRNEAAPGAPVSHDASGWVEAADGTHGDDIDVVAGAAGPTNLAPLTEQQRDAVLTLEWADWLGAVLGVVRGGAGKPVDGRRLVDEINRCPEVTSTIPKADRDRIEWAFDVIVDSWNDVGILNDGVISERGLQALPAGLHRAWSPRS